MQETSLLFSAFIFLTAAVIVVPLAKKGGLGAVLGYLLAGVAIGPYALRLITNPEDILHFAEFGIIMMLFLIGLELQPSILWRLRKSIIGLGGLQVILTTFVFTVASIFFGLHWTTSLIIGMALALSSTAVSLQILHEKNMIKTFTGQSAFSVLLFQDIAVIPILLLVPLLALAGDQSAGGALVEVLQNVIGKSGEITEPETWGKWLVSAKGLAIVVIVATLGHYGGRHLFRFIASTGIREIFTATALLIVIGMTLLMEQIGLSAALGAFIAGVVLATSEYRHEIEVEIEPFKALLLGLFFISVGMSINFDVILAEPFIVIGILLGLIVVKIGILCALGHFFDMQKRQYSMFAAVLAQGGEFAFVVFKLALTENLLTDEDSSILTVVVALSMGLTPLLVLAREKLIKPFFAAYTPLPNMPKPEARENAVILVGYGRFGQTVGRILHAQNIKATILDHDPNQIETARKFGWKVFFGDVLNTDLLQAAGIKDAQLIILAIDDREKVVRATSIIKKRFPHVKIMARAYDRRHSYDLDKAGVNFYVRETFWSAAMMGEEILKSLGVRAFAARNKILSFAKYDEEILKEAFSQFENESHLIALAGKSRSELEQIFARDEAQQKIRGDDSWGG